MNTFYSADQNQHRLISKVQDSSEKLASGFHDPSKETLQKFKATLIPFMEWLKAQLNIHEQKSLI